MMEDHQTCLSQGRDATNAVDHPAVCIKDQKEVYTPHTPPRIKEEPHWHEQGHSPPTLDCLNVSIKEEPVLCKEKFVTLSNQEEPFSPEERPPHVDKSTPTSNTQLSADYVKVELTEDDGTFTGLIEEDPFSHGDQTAPNSGSITDHPSAVQPNSTSLLSEIEVIYQNPPNSTFGDIANLTRYSRAHSKRKTPQCSVCGKYFLRRAHLVAHEVTHPEQFTVSCSKCDQAFPSTAELLAHKKTHRPETVFLCLECGRCFSGRGQLVLHQRRHLREKSLAST